MGKFEQLYDNLNKEQKLAVDTIEGPVMVVAGPGTGKTAVLTLRIANILKRTDVPPDAILALTFTDAAAREMKRRLVEIVGPAGYRVTVSTFHGFANSIIERYPEDFPRLVGAIHIEEVERAALLEEIFDALPLTLLRPYGDPYYYLQAARKRISDCKRENISPELLVTRINEHRKEIESSADLRHEKGAHKGKVKGSYTKELEALEKLAEFAEVYERYEALLLERRLYDYDDMILEVVRTLEGSENFRLKLSEEYQYILADEHQDANGAQNRLLELLASFFDEPNLFVVGDEKQAIFRFQGASLENFRNFKARYPSAQVVVLNSNYRSTQGILDAAHALSRTGMKYNGAPLSAARGGSDPIRLAGFQKREYELLWLTRELAQGSGSRAVLVRDNADAEVVSRALSKARVPHVLETDDDLFSLPIVRELITLLSATDNFGLDVRLVPALHAPSLGLDPLSVYRLLERAASSRRGVYESMRGDPEFARIYSLLASWQGFARARGVLSLIETLINESGLLARALASPEPDEALGALSSFLDYAGSAASRAGTVELSDLLRHIELSQRYKIKHKVARSGASNTPVRIMTAHHSKGLEFDRVYIVFAEDGRWGGRRVRESLSIPGAGAISELDDERRLFYVALTRAREKVSISFSREVADKEYLPTRFLSEIDPALVTDVTPGQLPEEREVAKLALSPVPEPTSTLEDGEFVREKFAERGLNVTALNNYLECPWKYFYQSLLRTPRARTKFELYGSAVHEALHRHFEHLRLGEEAPLPELLTNFETNMKKSPLPQRELEESLARGVESLSGYYRAYANNWSSNILNEFDIKGVHLGEGENAVLLRGRLDKIILGSGGTTVVDYKTSRPKSRNELAGNTKSSLGNEYRQLIFYKILLERYADGKFKMREGLIDFVEPNERGIFKQERFTIEDEEKINLEKEIMRVADEIRTLAFWNRRCENTKCDYCPLRNMM